MTIAWNLHSLQNGQTLHLRGNLIPKHFLIWTHLHRLFMPMFELDAPSKSKFLHLLSKQCYIFTSIHLTQLDSITPCVVLQSKQISVIVRWFFCVCALLIMNVRFQFPQAIRSARFAINYGVTMLLYSKCWNVLELSIQSIGTRICSLANTHNMCCSMYIVSVHSWCRARQRSRVKKKKEKKWYAIMWWQCRWWACVKYESILILDLIGYLLQSKCSLSLFRSLPLRFAFALSPDQIMLLRWIKMLTLTHFDFHRGEKEGQKNHTQMENP